MYLSDMYSTNISDLIKWVSACTLPNEFLATAYMY